MDRLVSRQNQRIAKKKARALTSHLINSFLEVAGRHAPMPEDKLVTTALREIAAEQDRLAAK